MTILNTDRVGDAIQTLHKYANNYGAIVVQTPNYGENAPGLFLVSMVSYAPGTNDWSFCLDGGPANSTIGYLTSAQTAALLALIEALV